MIVQVAKDPIATKGARLTCHVSLPGRHLVCMPTIDHVGVSRRIEREDERRRLRDFVERNRPRKVGFIVRTASGGKDPESWIKQDIDYLSKLWTKIKTRADEVSAPSIVYEDLNSILRAIRDWVNEDIDRIIVDSRYHYNELLEFADRFMPALNEKIELYQGDIPIFDAYGLSSELHRSLERRVWLKSGGYIVIDQAEALVAIDVNTGRFVGKKNLEDTILKTNMEAAEEIAYQLRLRNCGGIIIVDFIDMERDENRMRVYRALDEALKRDRARPTIQKISELGLVEMTRKRTRDTIIRSLCEPCTHCEGKGFTKSQKTVAYEILREIERLSVDREAKKLLVSAHEQVIDILAIDLREVVDLLEKRFNKQVFLQTIMDFHNEQFEVVTDRTAGKKQSPDIARQLRIERDRSERKEKQKQRQKELDSERAEQGGSDDKGESPEFSSALEAEYSNEENNASQARAPRERSHEKSYRHDRPEPNGLVIRASSVKHEPLVPSANLDEDGQTKSEEPAKPRVQFAPRSNSGQNAQQGGAQNAPKPRPAPHHSTQGGYSAGNSASSSASPEDEDQLAYLRAQAAQDAALAKFGNGGGVQMADDAGNSNRPQNHRHQRNQNGRNQNNRNNPRHQNHRGAQGGQNGGRNQNQRFRHQAPRGDAQPMMNQPVQHSAPQQAVSDQVPDYEVLVKSDGDSNS